MSLMHQPKPMDVKHAESLDTFWRRWIQDPLKIFGPYVQPGMEVMDFGCGSGFATDDLAKLVGPTGRVTAVDCQQAMLEITMEKVTHSNIDYLHYQPGEGIDTDKKLGSYDLVIAFYVLHEVAKLEKVLADIRSVLKPGGKLMLIEFSFDRHFESYLDAAIAQGFSVRKGPRVFMSRTAELTVPETPPLNWNGRVSH